MVQTARKLVVHSSSAEPTRVTGQESAAIATVPGTPFQEAGAGLTWSQIPSARPDSTALGDAGGKLHPVWRR
jgi:hypothetical protein